MPHPSDPRPSRSNKRRSQPSEQARPSAAHFLRGASGFGVVVFREKAQPTAPARIENPGHADCLLIHATLAGWAWQDPQRAAKRAQEYER